MIRITMVLLCLMLAAAAAGRYQAEVRVKQLREEINAIERAKVQEATEIQLLRAEIAYLESPERLAAIAGKVTALEPMSGRQLMTADDFIVAFGGGDNEDGKGPLRRPAPPTGDTIMQAIAMVDASFARPEDSDDDQDE